MIKRVALVAGTLAVVFGVLVVYQGLMQRGLEEETGVDSLPAVAPEPCGVAGLGDDPIDVVPITIGDAPGSDQVGTVKMGEAERLEFVDRDPVSLEVTRRFGFARRRRDSGPETLELEQPWFLLFDDDGGVVEITAERVIVPVGQADPSIGQLPESGRLAGDLQIRGYRLSDGEDRESFTLPVASDPCDGACTMERSFRFVARMEAADFELEFSRMRSRGRVAFESEALTVEGAGLSLVYDQVHRRLQELVLDELSVMRLRGGSGLSGGELSSGESDGLGGDGLAGSAGSGGGGELSDAGDGSSGDDDAEWYRMSVSEEVRVEQGGDRLLADRLDILARVDRSLSGRGLGDRSGGGGDVASSGQQGGTEREGGEDGVGSFGGDEIVVRCGGGLHIQLSERPSESVTEPLQITAFGKPVRLLRGGAELLRAGVVHMLANRREFEALPGEAGAVALQWSPEDRVTAATRLFVAGLERRAVLRGPGRVFTTSGGVSRQVDYQDRVEVLFAAGRGVGGGADKDAEAMGFGRPKRLSFSGGIRLVDPNGMVESEDGELVFFDEADGSGATVPQLSRVELSGDVRGQGWGSRFMSSYLEAEFARVASGESVLERLLARGGVLFDGQAYRLDAQDRVELAFASDPCRLAGGGFWGDRWSGSSEELAEDGDGSPLAMVRGLGDRLVSARLWGSGGGVRLEAKERGYVLTGDYLDGDGESGVWTVVGEPARVVADGSESEFQELQGDVITAELGESVFTVVGPGHVSAMVTEGFQGGALSEAVPVRIGWSEMAVYEPRTSQMTLYRVDAEMEQSGGGVVWRHRLRCPEVVVDGVQGEMALGGRDGEPVGVDRGGAMGQDVIHLRALGPKVELSSRAMQPLADGGYEAIRQVVLESSSLRFDEGRGDVVAEGPGYLTVHDLQAAPLSDAGEAMGQAAALGGAVGGAFASRGPSYTMIDYRDRLAFDVAEQTVRFTGKVVLHSLPLVGLEDRSVESLSQLERVDGRIVLSCQELSVSGPADPPGGDGVDGEGALLGQVGGFRARGSVVCELIENGDRQLFTAREAWYDGSQRSLVFRGDEGLPVRFNMMQFSRVIYYLDTGEFQARPLGESIISGGL